MKQVIQRGLFTWLLFRHSEALDEKGRETLTVTIKEVNAGYRTVDRFIRARAVGLYAHLININAYHQPGVEAGKKAVQIFLI